MKFSKNIRFTLLSIILTWFFTALQAQDINQKTKEGQKTGKWVTFLPNGKIQTIDFYRPYSYQYYTNERLFTEGILYPKDSMVYSTEHTKHLRYDYTNQGDFLRVFQWKKGEKNCYFYGQNQEIQVLVSDVALLQEEKRGVIGSLDTLAILLQNTSSDTLFLKPEFESQNFKTIGNDLKLVPQESKKFACAVEFVDGNHDYNIYLKNSTIQIRFSIKTLGYHVDSEQVRKGKKSLYLKKVFTTELIVKVYSKSITLNVPKLYTILLSQKFKH